MSVSEEKKIELLCKLQKLEQWLKNGLQRNTINADEFGVASVH